MAQSILLSTVICTLIVLHFTTTTKAQWKQCFDDSCPIKNIKFTEKSRSYEFAAEFEKTTSLWTPNVDKTGFELKAPPSDGPGQTIEIECDNSNVLFTCNARVTQIYNDASNQTITDYNIYPEINGTAIYINDKLYCSWAITMNDYTFPYELIDPPHYYISRRGYQIYYNLTQTVPVAAANYSQLPASVQPFVDGYQYKAVGSEKYLLIARVTSEKTDFLLKNNGEAEDKKLVEVNLKSDINSINIQCDFTIGTYYVFGFTNAYDMNSESDFLDIGKINGDKCLWSLDDSLEVHSFTVKPKKTTYELQIIENKRFVHYDENGFRIPPSSASSSNNMTIAKSLLIVMLFSVFSI